MIFRDLLVGVKQELEECELAFELLAEKYSRLSRKPPVIEDRYWIVSRAHRVVLQIITSVSLEAGVFCLLGAMMDMIYKIVSDLQGASSVERACVNMN